MSHNLNNNCGCWSCDWIGWLEQNNREPPANPVLSLVSPLSLQREISNPSCGVSVIDRFWAVSAYFLSMRGLNNANLLLNLSPSHLASPHTHTYTGALPFLSSLQGCSCTTTVSAFPLVLLQQYSTGIMHDFMQHSSIKCVCVRVFVFPMRQFFHQVWPYTRLWIGKTDAGITTWLCVGLMSGPLHCFTVLIHSMEERGK